MSDDLETENPHGTTQGCAQCGDDIHIDIGRNERHFKVIFVEDMDRRSEHGILCCVDCLTRWANEQ